MEKAMKQNLSRKHSLISVTGLLRLMIATACTVTFSIILAPADTVSAAAQARLPKLIINTDGGEEPTCEIIYPPEEDMPGVTITGNSYVHGSFSSYELPGGAVTVSKDKESDAPASDTATDAAQTKEQTPGSLPVKVKVRGNSSAIGAKKSYKLKFEEPVELLNRGPGYADKEWLLLNNGSDLKTWLGFWLSKRLGMAWTPSVRFVDVEMNGKNKGIYLLSESVEVGAARVNIPEAGALFEEDVYWWNEDGNYFRTKNLPVFMAYTWKYPEDAAPDDKRIKDLQTRMQRIENKLSLHDVFIGKELDLDSMASWLLVRDILGHGDPAGSNLYFYTDNIRSGKIKMGPLWDFDAAFEEAERWSLQHDAPYLPFYNLIQNAAFNKVYASKWAAVAPSLEQELSQAMDEFYASEGAAIEESRRINSSLWGNFPTLADEIRTYKEFFHKQIPWIENQFNPKPVEPEAAPSTENPDPQDTGSDAAGENTEADNKVPEIMPDAQGSSSPDTP